MVLKSPENQHSLLTEPGNPSRHTVESLLRYAQSNPDSQDLGDVTVTLQERAETLQRAAEIYADYNKLTIGLGKAACNPGVVRELEDRYGLGTVPAVVKGARDNSFYAPVGGGEELDFDNPPLELRMLEGVLKTREFLAAGVDPRTLSAKLQPLIVGIRHAIGTVHHDVRAPQRNAEMKRVKATARRASQRKN